MKKILATLDFDGVISPIDKSYDFKSDDDFSGYRLGAFTCYIRNTVFDFVTWLSENTQVETVWATSWDDMTQHFNEDTEGRLPHLPYLHTDGKKGDRILEEAVRLNVEEVHVFEDDGRVRTRINTLMKRTPEAYPFKVVFHKTALKQGLTDRVMSSVKSQLSV